MSKTNQFEQSPYLTTEAAAQFLSLSPKTLEKYRVTGGGPRFRKHGRRVLYAKDDLKDWSDERAYDSTTQADLATLT